MDSFDFPSVIPPDHEDFLLNDDANLDGDKHSINWLRNHYAQKHAILWGRCVILKNYLKQSESYWGVQYASMENPVTKKPYGVEAGKALARSAPDYNTIHLEWVKLEVEKRQVLAYVQSLDGKADFIPGAQGRVNRTIQYNDMTEE